VEEEWDILEKLDFKVVLKLLILLMRLLPSPVKFLENTWLLNNQELRDNQ